MLLLIHFLGYFILFSRVLQLSSSHSCHKELKLNWTVTISDSPVVSSPLLVPSTNNGDTTQLLVVTHDGSVTTVNTASGQEDPQWPVHFPEKTFFAGPLLYDINQDGAMDILLTASDGEIIFLSHNGTLMVPYSIILPNLIVRRKWNILSMEIIKDRTKQPDLEPSSNMQFISLKEYRDGTSLANTFVLVDTHVLSTPVIGDFDGDGINSELIIPVNFYFDEGVKKDPVRLKNLTLEASEIDFYLANAMVVVDLRTREVIFNVTLELTMKSSDFPSYFLSSPTVVDLDGNSGDPEVIIGSSSGKIHVWNKAGIYPQSFELLDSIKGEIAVGDTNNDGTLEIVVVDASANVVCYDNKKIIWEATVSGTMTAGPQFQDIDQDGAIEVVIATNDGYIWILDGHTGKVRPNWPLKLGDEVYSKVMFYKNLDMVDMIVMSKGNMNIIGGSSHCLEVIPTDEISYVPVIFDLNHEAFIVSTTDGTVMSFQQQNRNGTIFPIKQTGITFTKATKDLRVITAQSFSVEYDIFDNQDETHKWKSYTVILSFSTEKGVVHHVSSHDKPGVYVASLRAPQAPKKSYILVELCNQFKQCCEDIIYIQFHPETQDHLIVYLILPFLVMVSVLLLLHGYPEGNLLPTWESCKEQ